MEISEYNIEGTTIYRNTFFAEFIAAGAIGMVLLSALLSSFKYYPIYVFLLNIVQPLVSFIFGICLFIENRSVKEVLKFMKLVVGCFNLMLAIWMLLAIPSYIQNRDSPFQHVPSFFEIDGKTGNDLQSEVLVMIAVNLLLSVVNFASYFLMDLLYIFLHKNLPQEPSQESSNEIQ